MVRNILISALAVGLAGMGCGGDDDGGGNGGNGNGSLTISSFTASAESVRSGQTVTLNWRVSGATFVEVTQVQTGQDPVVIFTDAAYSGSPTSVESNPIGSATTFRLVAANAEDQTEDSVSVSVTGIRIDTFAANPSTGIRSGDVITLEWVIEGANVESLEILDEDGNVPIDGDDNPIDPRVGNTGEVTVKVLGDLGAGDDTESYTLRAVGGGGNAEATVTVDVEVALPIIDVFETTVQTNTIVFGQTVSAEWNVRNATRVIILFDGNVCADNTNFENGVNNRSACSNFPVENASHTLEIRVGNVNTPTEADFVTEQLTISGTDPVSVDSFSISPETYWQGAADITFTWETTVANRAELQERVSLGGGQFRWCTITETPAPGCREFGATAPTTPDGSFVFEVVGAQRRDFRVLAILEADGQEVDTDNESLVVQGDFNEPPSSFDNPLLINTRNVGLDQRATITNPNEEDWYAVDVPDDGRILARAGVATFDIATADVSCLGGGQLADTRIELFDDQQNLLGSVGGNAFDALGVNDPACAVMVGHRHPFAMDLTAGRYYFRVTGENLRTGQYTFNVNTFEPEAEPFTEITAVGGPQWEIADINVVAIPLVTAALIWPYSNHTILANGMSPLFRHSVVYLPNVPHQRNYRNEIQPAWQAAGFKLNDGFVPLDVGQNTPMSAVPLGLALTYTVVPTGGTSTTTFDYLPLGEATGPALPFSAFPIVTEEQSFGKSFGDGVFDENVNPMNGDPIDGLGYPVVDVADRTDVTGGVSHRHFMHLNSVAFMDTSDIVNPVDRYTWTVHIFDDTGGGYELEVSFDINSP
jgi:hypothetical protein